MNYETVNFVTTIDERVGAEDPEAAQAQMIYAAVRQLAMELIKSDLVQADKEYDIATRQTKYAFQVRVLPPC